jgi:hypothetical protein
MKAQSHLVIDKLMQLAKSPNTLTGEKMDHLLSHFLLVTSNGSDTLQQLQNVEYRSFHCDEDGGEIRSGLAIGNEDRGSILLTDFVSSLMHLPAAVIEDMDVDVCRDEYIAALKVIWAILACFEYSSFDGMHPERYSSDEAEKLLKSVERSLKSFRGTGVP